jgi:hypothetical protein
MRTQTVGTPTPILAHSDEFSNGWVERGTGYTVGANDVRLQHEVGNLLPVRSVAYRCRKRPVTVGT